MKTIDLYDNSNLQMANCRKIGIREKKLGFTAAKNVPPLVIGFDTEYVAVRGKSEVPEQGEAPYDFESEDSIGFKPFNEVLSYQFFASYFGGDSWKGIGYTDRRGKLGMGGGTSNRIPLNHFLEWVFSEGIGHDPDMEFPNQVYLVGHFTLADLPAFTNFGDMKKLVDAVRKTFITTYKGTRIQLEDYRGSKREVTVNFRDTLLLAPEGKGSLDDIGEIVGYPKLKVSQFYKEHMDEYLLDCPEEFEEYGIRDAEICVKYAERIMEQTEGITGRRYIPPTLSSLGVEHLSNTWKKHEIVPTEVLGTEVVNEYQWNKKEHRTFKSRVSVPIDIRFIHENLAIECYHGGRNEQYFFGPGEEDDWVDYDLRSAYTTAMSIIGTPLWDDIYSSRDISDFLDPSVMGFALVEFEFPEKTRFPCLPVRCNAGILYPMKGRSCCCTPEIVLAKEMGATVEILHGIILPDDKDVSPFKEFITSTLENRNRHPKGSLENLFWKQIGNSCYGKLAQGLKKKRCFDTRSGQMKTLPESKITNPFLAAYITSMVRATLSEVLSKLPNKVKVCNATTDGFLSNVNTGQLNRATSGKLCRLFSKTLKMVTGDGSVLEIKHQIRKPLGWRTRGQATLKQYNKKVVRQLEKEQIKPVVLAKAGIKPEKKPGEGSYIPRTDEEQNDWIVSQFFERDPSTRYKVDLLTGIRDVWENEGDLLGVERWKRLSMDYDWKRDPIQPEMRSGSFKGSRYNHLFFDSQPWVDLESFHRCREKWENFNKNERHTLKTLDDFRNWDYYRRLSQQDDHLKTFKVDSDLKRFRMMFLRAYVRGEAGLTKEFDTYTELADWLSEMGIETKKHTVENAARPDSKFYPHNCEPSNRVLAWVRKIKEKFPNMDSDLFFIKNT